MFEKILPYLGGLGLIVGTVLTWMTAGRKAGVDESAIVFAQWEKLMNSHKDDMRILKGEFQDYKQSAEKQFEARNQEINGLRDRLNTVENNFADFRRESDERIRLLDDENRGLRRQITQVGDAAHAEVLRIEKRSAKNTAEIEGLKQ